MHDPGTADRLHVDLALPALAGGVLHIGVGGDDRVEYRGLQFEDALKGRVQMDAGGRVGGVRFQLELRVGCLVRKVERQRRVGRAGVHGKGADRLLLVRREQCEAGGEDAEKGNLKKDSCVPRLQGVKMKRADLLLVCILTSVGGAWSWLKALTVTLTGALDVLMSIEDEVLNVPPIGALREWMLMLPPTRCFKKKKKGGGGNLSVTASG